MQRAIKSTETAKEEKEKVNSVGLPIYVSKGIKTNIEKTKHRLTTKQDKSLFLKGTFLSANKNPKNFFKIATIFSFLY